MQPTMYHFYLTNSFHIEASLPEYVRENTQSICQMEIKDLTHLSRIIETLQEVVDATFRIINKSSVYKKAEDKEAN